MYARQLPALLRHRDRQRRLRLRPHDVLPVPEVHTEVLVMPAETKPETPCCCRMVLPHGYADPYDFHSPNMCGYTPGPIKDELEGLRRSLAELREENAALSTDLRVMCGRAELWQERNGKLVEKAALCDEIAVALTPFLTGSSGRMDVYAWLARYSTVNKEDGA